MTTSFAVALTSVALAIAAHALPPQTRDTTLTPPATSRGTAAIAGTVVSTESPSRPLRRVTVTVTESAAPMGGRLTVTDDAGRFEVRDLPPGRYRVVAAKAAYLTATYGATRIPKTNAVQTGTPIALIEGQRMSDITIRMTRGSVLTGVIRDQHGQPAAGVNVGALFYRRAIATGERVLSSSISSRSTTDDRGAFRIFGLAPGDYVIAAVPAGLRTSDLVPTTDADLARATTLVRRGGTTAPTAPAPPVKPRTMGFAPVFYPGTVVAADATPVTLAGGEERSGLDFALQLVPTARIEGTVAGVDGSPAAGQLVRMVSHAPSLGPLDVAGLIGLTVTTDATGRFQLAGVTPGTYTLTVRGRGAIGRGAAPAPGAPTASQWATTDVTVRGEDLRVSLAMQEGFAVSGRLTFNATAPTPPPDLSRIRVTLTPVLDNNTGAMLGVAPATPDAGGAFTFAGVVPGRYRLTATIPAGAPGQGEWAIKSSQIGGQEALDAPVDVRGGDAAATVTLTDRITEIAGAMLDASGQPAPEYFIIAFSADRAHWTPASRRVQQVRPGRDGKFAFRNLPPGNYLIAAVTDVEQGEWFDPAFLTQLVDASLKLSLAEGEKKTQNIRVR